MAIEGEKYNYIFNFQRQLTHMNHVIGHKTDKVVIRIIDKDIKYAIL